MLLTAAAIATATAAFLLHADLSAAGFLELLLVLLVALRWGAVTASLVSLAAFLCLNFFFTEPVLSFSVNEPQNWISLFTFEATALLVSHLSSKVREHSSHAEEQRLRAVKLYELSRAVLLIDQRHSTKEQLSSLIREILRVDEVQFWLSYDERNSQGPSPAAADGEAYRVYLSGINRDDASAQLSERTLRLGTSVIGGMVLRGEDIDPLSADAAASIAAVAFERTRAIHRETRAEVERDAERLRAAVLDALAHGFKTPLTAIQTASSGLLAIDGLSETQAELVSIIDDRATMLGQLTKRLLQTAALEAKEIKLKRASYLMTDIIEDVVRQQDPDVRARISVHATQPLDPLQLDATMVSLAMQQLLDNAAKYSEVGSSITIDVSQTNAAIRVVVENKAMPGHSIRPGEIDRIFERFFRGADALMGPSGTGLGLSIVKKIAEAHGGSVWAECMNDTIRFIFALDTFKKAQNE